MFKRRTGVLLLLSCGSIAFSGVFSGLYAAWNSQNTNGNPVIPGYFADPSIIRIKSEQALSSIRSNHSMENFASQMKTIYSKAIS